MKLMSMTDFVLEQKQSTSFKEKEFIDTELLSLEKIRNYANFLKQPLELWMFVPCDEKGNVLEEECNEEELCKHCPLKDYRKHNSVGDSCEGSRCDIADENYKKQYQQAKERCLFAGFEWKRETNNYYFFTYNPCYTFVLNKKVKNTIEHLINQDVKLTQNALKQIGL